MHCIVDAFVVRDITVVCVADASVVRKIAVVDLDDDTEPLFKQSSLRSIRKMVSNNNIKRFFGSVESSPS